MLKSSILVTLCLYLSCVAWAFVATHIDEHLVVRPPPYFHLFIIITNFICICSTILVP